MNNLGLGGFNAMDFLRAKTLETTNKVTLTSGAAVHGAYVELIDPTTIQYNWITVILDDTNTTNEYEVHLATGAAGSEVDFVTELEYHVDLTGNSTITIVYPLKTEIPKGVRIAANVLATNNTDTIDIHLIGQGI